MMGPPAVVEANTVLNHGTSPKQSPNTQFFSMLVRVVKSWFSSEPAIVPCQLFLPEGVISLTTEPEFLPYSGAKLFVVIWYCSTKSGLETKSPGPATELSLLFCPSISWSLLRPRSPSTEKPTPFVFEKP